MILLMALTGWSPVFGQKCKYTMDKTDPFTGEHVNTIVHQQNGFTWVNARRGSKYFIEMNFMSVESTQSFTMQDTMRIKLADGTILKLRPNSDVPPSHGEVSRTTTAGSGVSTSSVTRQSGTAVTNTTSITSYSPIFEVDRAVYDQLAKSPMTIIRFEFAGKPWDFDFTRKPLLKAAPVLMNNARCIVSLN